MGTLLQIQICMLRMYRQWTVQTLPLGVLNGPQIKPYRF